MKLEISNNMKQTHDCSRESRQAGGFRGVLIAFLLSLVMTVPAMAANSTHVVGLAVADLRCEDLVDPLGIDILKPRLSWRMLSNKNGAAQSAYHVLVATSPELLKEGSADLWDSGKVSTSQSQHIVYAGKSLSRGSTHYWTVRIWNKEGDVSSWSKPAVWTLFNMPSDEDWQAQWITEGSSSPWLRKSAELSGTPERAYIYVNALGYFQLFINGERVGEDEFAPHVGQYNKRTFCITYDVTKYLKKGQNAIGFWLGSGWSRRGAGVKTAPCVRAQLEIADANGYMTTLVTDETWRAKASSMAYRGEWKWNQFGGEVHTGPLDQPDWADAGFDDSAWPAAKQAQVADAGFDDSKWPAVKKVQVVDAMVSSEMLQRNRIIETITPLNVMKLVQDGSTPGGPNVASGETVRIKIMKAMYGDPNDPNKRVDLSVKLQTMADKKEYRFKMTNGFAGRDPSRGTWKQLLLEYDLNGKRISRRFDENDDCALVAIGTPGAATANYLVDMGKAMTGTFEITFPKAPEGHKISMEFGDSMNGAKPNSFNQASEYICRGSGIEMFKNRFNYASCRYILMKNVPAGEFTPENIRAFLIATDLPKASTFNCSNETLNGIYQMMDHTLRCLMLGGYQVDCHSRERYGYGGDGHSSLDTTLNFLRSDAFYRKWTRDWLDGQNSDGGLSYTSPVFSHGGGPFWPGFLTAATLKHYHHYGDISLVRRNYPAIKKWFELAQSKTDKDLQQKFCGGWYLGDWASPKGINDKRNAEAFILPYMSYALEQAAQLADALKETADAETFRKWAAARNVATHKKLFNPKDKKYGSGDQVTYIAPLIAGTVPDEVHDEVFAGFEKTLMVKNSGHLSTGLSGTYLMIQYLQSIGRGDLIYTFASKKTFPSWGYMIEKGATATWEHWNGKASRIHNCYNNIGSWFIEGLAGIRPDTNKPGYQNAIIKPAFIEELSYVKGSHDSLYGTIESHWKRDGDAIILAVKIPPNSTGTVYVPAQAAADVTVNGQKLSKADHVTFLSIEDRRAVIHVGAGRYEFSCK